MTLSQLYEEITMLRKVGKLLPAECWPNFLAGYFLHVAVTKGPQAAADLAELWAAHCRERWAELGARALLEGN